MKLESTTYLDNPTMSIKIFIGNLSEEVESDDIRFLFDKHGQVDECDVLKNYGFVHMPKKSEATAAIAALNGHNIKGQRMRVELSTGKRGNPKGDRRGFDNNRERPYPPPPPGPPRRGPPPPDRYDPYDPYYRYPYPERDPYYRLPPLDRYLPPRLPPVDDRYPPLRRERLYPEDRGYLPPPPDPRDRYLVRERLPPYPEDPYDRLRERAPPADPYYRDRSPVARPPPEYYDRKAALMRPHSEAGNPPPPSRLSTTAYPPANGYDYYRRPAAEVPEGRPSYNGPAGGSQDYKNGPVPRAQSAYDRPAASQQQSQARGGYGMPHHQQQQSSQQQQKRYDSQSALQTKPIFF